MRAIATSTRRMGLLPTFQEEIIHRAIELNHVTVQEIMTPRGPISTVVKLEPLQPQNLSPANGKRDVPLATTFGWSDPGIGTERAAVHLDVDGVDARRPDLDERVARTGLARCLIGDLEHVGSAVGGRDYDS